MYQLPDAADHVYLVTGGNTGIGYFTAEQLAGTGATVVLGSRRAERAEAAMNAIRARVPGARVRSAALDLADLGSLRRTTESLGVKRLDAVVHNAGVLLGGPEPRQTRDGNEMHFGTNHLGHFALTHWLLPLLEAAPSARVVTVGSFAAKSERIDLDDLQSRVGYRAKRTYSRSKLAQMYFGLELDRRLRAAGSTVSSVVVHPGGALDSLTPSRPPIHVRKTGAALRGAAAALVLQGKHAGARPAVRAVLDPRIAGGELWGPRIFGLRGRPRRERLWAQLKDAETARRLWQASTELTGVAPAATA
ncbi:SDR family NAD(P)-dependent oxidoreductase [Streptomyces sp. AD55]|uniref:SDR family NAD(P)-dependent oxidoreductase n=1 Tax=Streptomyces sp. AD55 TaxID=3242895 RepID=UPI003527B0A3